MLERLRSWNVFSCNRSLPLSHFERISLLFMSWCFETEEDEFLFSIRSPYLASMLFLFYFVLLLSLRCFSRTCLLMFLSSRSSNASV